MVVVVVATARIGLGGLRWRVRALSMNRVESRVDRDYIRHRPCGTAYVVGRLR